MSDCIRGLFPPEHRHASWKEFIEAPRLKFQLSSADWPQYMESQPWKMNGDWPRFHTMINAYRQFLDKALEPALMLHMINGLDQYLMRKVVKEPKPQTLDEAIKKTWEAFRTTPPPMPSQQYPSRHYGTSQAQMPHQPMLPTQMDLDFRRPMSHAQTAFNTRSRPQPTHKPAASTPLNRRCNKPSGTTPHTPATKYLRRAVESSGPTTSVGKEPCGAAAVSTPNVL